MTGDNAENGTLVLDLAFPYHLLGAGKGRRESLFLLHGSGVDETSMVALARSMAPDAVLIAVRGRIPQEDGFRWFGRITPTRFDQESIRVETAAFAAFAAEAAARHGLDLGHATFLGYSNGANLVSSLMLLHPGIVRRAALLRPMPVLDKVPATDLTGTRTLIIAGAADETYGPFAPALVTLLSRHGTEIDARIVPSGHEIGDPDAAIIRHWLAGSAATQLG
ncbi:alpha/beta hydrolase [Mesorhizobium sp. ESP7-2]|uniref:alpha/beta hydrolase n=1 Tax=Mesorhizobium sp. ESP7-2 TaxID=2876622 RepID=UPI001CCD92D7|nr:alpha/beta hydrolase [Mesorhizobium sp. ESP7-2]MBZ9705427.1 alpha/beta hydrolase [Mesorhizobium sp. ESP7-2]